MKGAGSSSAQVAAHYVDDHRPRCHLAPPAGWMNDPNGPVFYKGRYHMFYQHLPDACEWDFGIIWGHAVSPDLVHWEHLPAALVPTPGWVDADGCFSGCCIIDPSSGRPVILYTGVRLRSNTSAGPLPPPEQDLGMVWIESQCAAVPADPNDDLLVEWKKIQAPFLPLPPKEMELTGWRDPFAFSLSSISSSSTTSSHRNSAPGLENSRTDGKVKEEQEEAASSPSKGQSAHEFRILMGSGIKGKGGTALIYRSTDLMQGWELEGTLCEGTIEDSGVVWECPLLVPLLPVPVHQRSRHPHIPPPWLHQPIKISNSKSSITLRELSPGTSGLPKEREVEKEKFATVGDGVGTTSSALGSQFGRHNNGNGGYVNAVSSPALLGMQKHTLESGESSSKEGSPLMRSTAAAAATAAKNLQQQLPLIPSAITTAVKDLLHVSKQKKGKEEDEESQFEFNSSAGASPGESSDLGTTSTTTKDKETSCTTTISSKRGVIDRQGSVDLWPSAEATSPVQELSDNPPLQNLESYHSIALDAGAATDFPVHELAAKLERAATLEHWNAEKTLGSAGSGNGGSGSQLSDRSSGFGSRLGNYDSKNGCDNPEKEEETTAFTTAAIPATASAPRSPSSSSRLMPPPAAASTVDGDASEDTDEDRFAMAFSRVPALTVKKKSPASLGLLDNPPTVEAATTTGGAGSNSSYLHQGGGVLQVQEQIIEKGYSFAAAGNVNNDQLLSSSSTDMMHPQQQPSQQQQGTTTNTNQRQWHFFTISPDAPTNPVLYWTGFMSHDQIMSDDGGRGGGSGSSKLNEEDAGPATSSTTDTTTNNTNIKTKPPPQFEIDTAKGPFRLDLGDILYAPNVCQDGQGRWILWGWLQERRKMGTYSYAGCLSLPRVLHTTDEGRLVQAPAPEVVALRKGREFHAQHVNLYPESMLPIQRVSGDRLDIECTIERGSALAAGLLFRSHEAEAEGSTAIVYDWDRNHLEAIFNVPPNWQPCLLTPGVQQQHPSSATAAAAASSSRDDFAFNEEDLIGLGDAIHFDPAAYLCTPRYSISRTPSMNVFSPDTMASSPHASPLVAGVFSDSSPPASISSPGESASGGSIFSGGGGMGSEIGVGGMQQQQQQQQQQHGGGGMPIAIQKQGSSLSHALQRSSSFASLGGAAIGGAGSSLTTAVHALESGAMGRSLAKTSSLLGTSVPRVGSFIQRQASFLAAGSPRSQAIIDAAEAAEMDAELSTLLEDLAAPMRGNAGEDGAGAPPQVQEPRRVGGPLLMRPSDKLHLRIFVDHSLVEVFTGTGEVLSTRIYRGQQPQSSSFFDGTGQVDAGIEFVAFGGAAVIEKVSAYEVGSAWKDLPGDTGSRWGTPTTAHAVQSAGVFEGGSTPKSGAGGGSSVAPSPMAGGNVGYGAANAAQVAEANRYKLDVEREVHPDVNIPEGTPAWAQAIATGIAALNSRLHSMQNSMQNRLDTMDGNLTALRHSTSQVRMLALANNQAATSTTILSPVPHETTGIMPPNTFPRTLEGLNGLTAPKVTGLLTFYDLPLQGGVPAKRKRLRQAIGVRTEL